MKWLFIFLLANLLACAEEPTGDVQFRFKKKEAAFYYAEYKFTHSDAEDVDIAVRIEYQGSKLLSMDFKNITMDDPVEKDITLSKSGSVYTGTTSGEHGGTYYVWLASGKCCGSIQFTPADDATMTFVGSKFEDLTAEQWATLTGATIAGGGDGISISAGHKHVGKVFTVTAKDGTTDVAMSLEAQSPSWWASSITPIKQNMRQRRVRWLLLALTS